MNDKNKDSRPEAYPKPTQTDQQLNHQDEYIDQKNNDQLSSVEPMHNERTNNETLNDHNNNK